MLVSAAPPSALPGISPSRGEIDPRRATRTPFAPSALNTDLPLRATHPLWEGQWLHPISPLEGEMSGRTEGGVAGHSGGWLP